MKNIQNRLFLYTKCLLFSVIHLFHQIVLIFTAIVKILTKIKLNTVKNKKNHQSKGLAVT